MVHMVTLSERDTGKGNSQNKSTNAAMYQTLRQ